MPPVVERIVGFPGEQVEEENLMAGASVQEREQLTTLEREAHRDLERFAEGKRNAAKEAHLIQLA